MPKIPALTPKDLVRIVEKNGFILDRIRGNHHIFYNLSNKKRIVIPMHKKNLPKGTLKSILKQAGISIDDFGD